MDVCLRCRYAYLSISLVTAAPSVLLLFSCSIHPSIDIDGMRLLFHRQSTCKHHELVYLASNNVNNWKAPRIAAAEQRYSPVSISIRHEKNVRDLQTRG
mgnify:CR=1 FL=1